MTTSVSFEVRLDDGRNILSELEKFVECFDDPKVTKIHIHDRTGKLVDKHAVDFKEKKNFALNEVYSILSKLSDSWWYIELYGGFVTSFIAESLHITKGSKTPSRTYSEPALGWGTYGGGYRFFIEDYTLEIPHIQKSDHKKLQRDLYRVLERVVNTLDPAIMWLAPETMCDLISFWFEYYRDPYFFCIDPELSEGISVEEVACDFLHDEDIRQELDGIRQVLPEDELISFIEKYSDDIIRGKEGIGVIRKSYEKTDFSAYEHYVYPRYFIRRELRKRGLKLKPGKTEEMIKDGIVSRPDIMREIGIIDEGIYERIVEATNMLSEKERSLENFESMVKKVIEKTLTKTELKELGLV